MLGGCNGREGQGGGYAPPPLMRDVPEGSGYLGPAGTGLLQQGGRKKCLGRAGKPEEAPTEFGAARCRY